MPFYQPSIAPLSPHTSAAGKTILITGANTGLGLATASTFLHLKASRLIFAVRSISKGEAARAQLLGNVEIRRCNPDAVIEIIHLDLEDFASVLRCTDQVKKTCEVTVKEGKEKTAGLDVLVLNAGASLFHYQRTIDGHETSIQVNYLSNILLMMSLLPLLKTTAGLKGSPGRITWVGSRRYKDYSRKLFIEKGLLSGIREDEELLPQIDCLENWVRWKRYNDTKFLAAIFVREIGKRLCPDEVTVNMCCPGMVNTGITNNLPTLLWIVMMAVMGLRGRSLEEGSFVLVRSGLGTSAYGNDHGRFLKDGEVEP